MIKYKGRIRAFPIYFRRAQLIYDSMKVLAMDVSVMMSSTDVVSLG